MQKKLTRYFCKIIRKFIFAYFNLQPSQTIAMPLHEEKTLYRDSITMISGRRGGYYGCAAAYNLLRLNFFLQPPHFFGSAPHGKRGESGY